MTKYQLVLQLLQAHDQLRRKKIINHNKVVDSRRHVAAQQCTSPQVKESLGSYSGIRVSDESNPTAQTHTETTFCSDI